MKCANCGAQLRDGCIYCSMCGQEVQIVPDYNLLEDDLLSEENKKNNEKRKDAALERGSSLELSRQNRKERTAAQVRQKRKQRILLGVGIAALAVVILILVLLLVRHNQNNSYDHQFSQAEKYVSQKEYAQAEDYLKRALELSEDETQEYAVQTALVDVYLRQERFSDAAELLQKMIAMNTATAENYQMLLDIYEESGNYEGIAKLYNDTKEEKLRNLFEGYIAHKPEFDREPGEYQEEFELSLLTEDDSMIYYTTDGSDPKEDGTEYEEPIAIPEGQVTVRAVACSKYGIYSEEMKGTYNVKFLPPRMPVVAPEGGTFRSPQVITIDIPKGCTVHFTWDGSDPTVESEVYLEPIAIPEGNNILSVIAVDARGLCSNVLKCNFTYIP